MPKRKTKSKPNGGAGRPRVKLEGETKRLELKLPEALDGLCRLAAEREHVTYAEWIRRAMVEHLREHARTSPPVE